MGDIAWLIGSICIIELLQLIVMIGILLGQDKKDRKER